MKAVRRSAVPIAIAVGGILLSTACDVNEASYTGNSGGQTVAIIGDDQTSTVQADLHTVMDPGYQSRNISHEGKFGEAPKGFDNRRIVKHFGRQATNQSTDAPFGENRP